jgi:TDG/mug DNA glycosylase family protein
VNALPDYLRSGLDVVFVGINPSLTAARTGHYYARRGNHFWPLLFESGLVTEELVPVQDSRVLEWNIGLTDIVARASSGQSDLSRAELRAGGVALAQKISQFAPRVICFNGKLPYQAVVDQRSCSYGEQREALGVSRVYVMPSTSARTAAYQRADKLAHFRALARLVRAQAAAPA